MIRTLVSRIEERGSVMDRPGSGTYRNIRTDDNVEAVQKSVGNDPSVSKQHCKEF